MARIKRGVRAGIDRCGGVDGAAATAERCRSVAGDWHNLNHKAFPPLDCAFALDEVMVAMGQRPELLSAYAAELGHVCIRLPEGGHGEHALSAGLIAASAEFGDIASEVRDATRDGTISARERGRIVAQIDEAMASLASLRALAEAEGES